MALQRRKQAVLVHLCRLIRDGSKHYLTLPYLRMCLYDRNAMDNRRRDPRRVQYYSSRGAKIDTSSECDDDDGNGNWKLVFARRGS